MIIFNVSGNVTGSTKQTSAFINAAREKLQQGKPSEAYSLAAAAVRSDPGSAQALLVFGITLKTLGSTKAAVSALQRAWALDSGLINACMRLCEVLRLEFRHEEAEDVLEAALEQHAEAISLWYALATTRRENNQPEAALDAYGQTIELAARNPNHDRLVEEARWWMAVCYLQLGDL